MMTIEKFVVDLTADPEDHIEDWSELSSGHELGEKSAKKHV